MLTNNFARMEDTLKRKSARRESEDPFYSKENIARLKKSIKQLERGQVVTKTFDELKELVYGQTAIH